MKFTYFLIITVLFLACKESVKDSDQQATESEIVKSQQNANLYTDDLYREFYDNGQVKIVGQYDDNDLKTGLWNAYFDNGNKLSSSNYKAGINNGYSIVYYPNGNVRYFGDYKDGERIGKWTFYDENGNVITNQN